MTPLSPQLLQELQQLEQGLGRGPHRGIVAQAIHDELCNWRWSLLWDPAWQVQMK